MRYFAVISDIHANWPALTSVVSDAEEISQGHLLSFISLGDAVDYGPHPNECINWLESDRRIAFKICGNHDQEMDCGLGTSPKIDYRHWAFTLWTRKSLLPKHRQAISKWCEHNHAKRHGIEELKQFVFFHGGLDGYLDEMADMYIPNQTPIKEVEEANRQFNLLSDRNALFGHTHFQGYFLRTDHMDMPDMQLAVPTGYALMKQKLPPQLLEVPAEGIQWIDMPDGRMLINPGSVGQPRWHTLATSSCTSFPPIACYLLLKVEHQRIQFAFRQCPYPYSITISDLNQTRWPQRSSRKDELETVVKLLEKAKSFENEHSVYRQPLEIGELTRSASMVKINQRLEYEIEHLIRAIDFNWQR